MREMSGLEALEDSNRFAMPQGSDFSGSEEEVSRDSRGEHLPSEPSVRSAEGSAEGSEGSVEVDALGEELDEIYRSRPLIDRPSHLELEGGE